jgi:hypothetical protein
MALNGTAILILLICVAVGLPPLLALRGFVRARARAARHGRPTGRVAAGIGLAGAGLLYNLFVLIDLVGDVVRGAPALGKPEAAAFGISWIAFWTWIFLALSPDSQRRT